MKKEDIIKEKLKNILNINWFKFKYWEYNRDDWILINCYQYGSYQIVFWDWNTIDINNQNELIWYLALHWIINRLF